MFRCGMLPISGGASLAASAVMVLRPSTPNRFPMHAKYNNKRH